MLDMVREFRTQNASTPVILMGYLNPIEVMGYEAFANAATEVGVDGVILVDLPPEEGEDLVALLKARNLDQIFLLAPTSTDERIERICSIASGFVYYVSLKGVTGAAHLDIQSVVEKVNQIRGHTEIPVGVGFGISNAETAAKVSAVADAVVVGSAVVKRVAENAEDPQKISAEVCGLLASMREAMDA